VGSLFHPRSDLLRKWLPQVQLTIGIGAGLDVAAIGLSGAFLLFRLDIQNAASREFLQLTRSIRQTEVPVSAIVQAVQLAYPRGRLIEIDWPRDRRDTFLVYLDRDDQIRTVFLHPTTGEVLGELPVPSWIRWLRELHVTLLLAGKVGMVLQGVGVLCLLTVCVTGSPFWWPGLARQQQTPGIDTREGWKRVNRECRRAGEFLMWVLPAMWAITGMTFVLARPAGSIVDVSASGSASHAPKSNPALLGRYPSPDPEQLIATAQYLFPGATMARLMPPAVASDPWLVVLARRTHGDLEAGDELSAYFDQYSGGVPRTKDHERTVDDTIFAWLGMLHFESFGGLAVKIVWAAFGLSLPGLFAWGLLVRRGSRFLRKHAGAP
jgi:uncharacterized iron-regulated membrane protein